MSIRFDRLGIAFHIRALAAGTVSLSLMLLTSGLAYANAGAASSQAETQYWESVKNSPDPADLQSYLDMYSHGRFAKVARNRLKLLKRSVATTSPQMPSPVADLSGKNHQWKKDPQSNCWVYSPDGASSSVTLADLLPGFLFKPLNSDGSPANVTIGDLLPGFLRKKLNGEADPADVTPSWSGACDSQLAAGEGTLAWTNNGKTVETITATFHGGLLSGHGVATWPNGDRYEGNFSNSSPNAHGVFRAADGATYDGNWVNGRMSGHGVSSNSVGTYEGEFLDNKQNGHGVFTLKNRDRIEGDWTNGTRSPPALYTFSDGARYEGDIPGNGTLTTPDRKRQPANAAQDEQGNVSINLGGQ